MRTPVGQYTRHYVLVLDVEARGEEGRWRFEVCREDGKLVFQASDAEPEASGERLGLLTAVRGLESLDGPARVTVVGCTKYLRRGLRHGLPLWRENQWQWEAFGQMVPVRDCDLWQRLDQALRFHEVEVRPGRDRLTGGNRITRMRDEQVASPPRGEEKFASASAIKRASDLKSAAEAGTGRFSLAGSWRLAVARLTHVTGKIRDAIQRRLFETEDAVGHGQIAMSAGSR